MAAQFMAVVALVVTSVAGFTSPASAVQAPKGLEAHFSGSLAQFAWGDVPGAKKFRLEIMKAGYYGPWMPHSTTNTQLNIAYDDFPYQNSDGTAYRIRVTSVGPEGGTASSVAEFDTKSGGGGVNTDKTDKAIEKAKGCLKNGAAAGVTTVAAGGIVVALSSWIPGVDVVTAGGLAAATAAAAGSTFVVCMVPWP